MKVFLSKTEDRGVPGWLRPWLTLSLRVMSLSSALRVGITKINKLKKKDRG